MGLKELARLAKGLKHSKTNIAVALGIIGIVLIGAYPMLKAPQAEEPKQDRSPTAQEYALALEDKLTNILTSVEGVGRVRIMVTLCGDYSYEYAKTAKVNNDMMEDVREGEQRKTQQKSITEESYILVEENSGETPVVTGRTEPQIKGVVVVCDGGGDPLVAARVTETVKVALELSSARISVLKLAGG